MRKVPPQSGVYEGYFSNKGKRVPFEVDLKWKGHIFEAEGVDDNENFTIGGTVESTPPWKVTIWRKGQGAKLTGEGYKEGSSGAMFGKWERDDEKGEWSIKPSSNPNSQFRERKRVKLIADLTAMGYDEALIFDALAATQGASLAAAIDWIANYFQDLARSDDAAARPNQLPPPGPISENSNLTSLPQEAVASLVSMGFHEEQAGEALMVCNNDVEKALEYLLRIQGE